MINNLVILINISLCFARFIFWLSCDTWKLNKVQASKQARLVGEIKMLADKKFPLFVAVYFSQFSFFRFVGTQKFCAAIN